MGAHGRYVSPNQQPLQPLKYNQYQIAFLDALRARFCPSCGVTFAVDFGKPDTKHCPACASLGERQYNIAALIAGRQGGKTRISTLACALEMTFPGTYGWICAPTYGDQEKFLKPTFFKQIPESWHEDGNWQAANDIFVAPNGSSVAFVSLDNPDAVRGPTLDFLDIDEACKISGKAFEVARPAMSINKGVIILTTTPKGEDWVYEQVWVPAEGGMPGFWAAKYRSIDNPVQDPEFIEQQRRTMSPEMFQQEYEADFVTFQGAIYGGLVDKCVIDDTDPNTYNDALKRIREYLPEWPKIDTSREQIIGIDPGSDHPFAAVRIVVTPKGLILCGELLERGKAAAQYAGGLKRMVEHGSNVRWGIDRSQAQMAIELAQHGIFAATAENAIEAGIERVKSWMLSGQFVIVKSRAPQTVKQLKSYRWKDSERPDGSKGKPEPYKKFDDLCDALRYDLMLWPHVPQAVEVQAGRDLSTLPEKTRNEIERVMRGDRERAEKMKVADGVGEFYDTTDHSDYAAESASVFEEMFT